jgi:hypothetical protein
VQPGARRLGSAVDDGNAVVGVEQSCLKQNVEPVPMAVLAGFRLIRPAQCSRNEDRHLQINDINRRLANLLEWLHAAEPDVVCLQELKATDASFPEAAIRDAGCGAVWRRQRTWNGVAILAKNAKAHSDPGRTARRSPRHPEPVNERC